MPSSPPPVDSALQAQIMQEHVNSQTELAFKKIIIDTINKQHAQSRTGLALRLPQPSPIAHCVCSKYSWTNEEAERYLQDGTLPRGLTTIGRTDTCVLLWLFDATAAGGKLPELDLDPIPDFEAHPALCAIVMGGGENIALILSEFLTSMLTHQDPLLRMVIFVASFSDPYWTEEGTVPAEGSARDRSVYE